jgi:ATP-dependent protease HslVU (ClpYQ) peptidase subunit
MKIMKKKTRRAIRKSVRKLANKHGREIAVGLIGSIASALATLANTEAPGSGGKSNLAKMSKDISKTLNSDRGSKLTKLTGRAKGRSAKRRKSPEQEELSRSPM